MREGVGGGRGFLPCAGRQDREQRMGGVGLEQVFRFFVTCSYVPTKRNNSWSRRDPSLNQHGSVEGVHASVRDGRRG